MTDPQPTEWRSVVHIPPEGPDASAAPPPVIVPLRRSGIGKRRVPVVVTYAVTPSTDVRLCFRVAVRTRQSPSNAAHPALKSPPRTLPACVASRIRA